MNMFAKILLIVSLILNLAFLWTTINYKPLPSNNDKYLETIDSLELELDSLSNYKDSIKHKIDTIVVELENNNKEYEEIYNTILSNSTSSDFIFFSEYLENYRKRLDSINNSFTIKRN